MTYTEKRLEEFDKKFTYSVVFGSTLNNRTAKRYRMGEYSDPQEMKDFIAESIAHAKQEVMKRVVEKWDKYVDVINEDAHYVIHNPVREGFKVVLSSLQIINLTKEE